jgi:TRAP-type C4-dicarboxylate transport system permease small subunit
LREKEPEKPTETLSVSGTMKWKPNLFLRMEKWLVTLLMITLSWISLSFCLYLVRGMRNINQTIEEEGLFNTEIQLDLFRFVSMDEDGERVVQHLNIPQSILTWILPVLLLLLGFLFLFKAYSSFLDAIEGQEKPLTTLMEKIDRGIERVETVILIGALGAMLLIYFIQIVLQNFASSWLTTIQGGNWMPQVSTLMVGVVGFFGASLALRNRRHISIDVASRLVPEEIMQQCRVLLDSFGFAVSLIFAFLSVDYVRFLREDGAFFTRLSRGTGVEAQFVSIPDWPLKLFIPAAFTILAFRFLKGTIDGLIKVKSRS